jgi:hypothetical protein
VEERVVKIRGVEILPNLVKDLDPLLYKDEFAFKHAWHEKIFDKD